MVLRDELAAGRLERLLERFGLELVERAAGAFIPGSYWGEPEAGLIGDRLFVRPDTPAHSVLHELAHYVCMTQARRERLSTNAGGDADEECAVCYLQVVLADELPELGGKRCLADMDSWGYSFREGSARAWWNGDGAAARAWLTERRLIDAQARPTWRLRS